MGPRLVLAVLLPLLLAGTVVAAPGPPGAGPPGPPPPSPAVGVIPPGREAVVEALVTPDGDGLALEAASIEQTVVRVTLRAGPHVATATLRHPDDATPAGPDVRRTAPEGSGVVVDLSCATCTSPDWTLLEAWTATVAARARARGGELWEGATVAWTYAHAYLAALLLVLAAAGWASGRTLAEAWRALRADGRPVRPFAVALAATVAVGLTLRAVLALTAAPTANELWLRFDTSILDYLATPEATINPPLYALLAWPLKLAFGSGIRVERFASVLTGGLFVAAAGLLVTAWSGRRGGLLVAVIAAIHPMALGLGAANRTYGLGLLGVALAFAAVARARESGVRRDVLAAAVLVGVLPWIHVLLVGASLGLALWLVLGGAARRPRLLVPAVAVALAVVLPLAVPFLRGTDLKLTTEANVAGWAGVVANLSDMPRKVIGWDVPTILDHALVRWPSDAVAAGALLGVLAVAAAVAWRRVGLGVLLLAGGATAALVFVAQLVATVRGDQAVALVVPAIGGLAALAGGFGTGRLPRVPRLAAHGVLATLALAPLLLGAWRMLAEPDPVAIRATAQAIAAHPGRVGLVVDPAAEGLVALELADALGEAPQTTSPRVRSAAACTPAAAAGATALVVLLDPRQPACSLARLGLTEGACPALPGRPRVRVCVGRSEGDARGSPSGAW